MERRSRSGFLVVPLALGLSLGNLGCIKSMLLNGQIASTRKASEVGGTLTDVEMARAAASSGLATSEGMHRLAPDNEDALYMLTRGWASYAFAFVEDDMEVAHDHRDSAAEDYHRDRAVKAYDRALFYGKELLAKRAGGFDEAIKSDGAFKAWLRDNFTSKDDAENLHWVASAWMAKVAVQKDSAEVVAQLWVGVAMMERSVELWPDYNHFSGMAALASYHARSVTAEVDEAARLFEKVLAETKRHSLMVQLGYATRLACVKADGKAYTKLLEEVVKAPDEEPDLRLTNALARRRAHRWLGEKRMFEFCSIDK